MKILLILFIILCPDRTSTHRQPSLVVVPGRSQFFEYEDVTLRCEQTGSADWTVWRYSESGSELSPCGSAWGSLSPAPSCQLTNVKQFHSGVYWCESPLRDSSQAVHLQVSEGSVLLDSPVLPVTAGQDVTLCCRSRGKKKKNAAAAQFFKNGVLMEAEPCGHMTIHNVSRSNEDVYTCRIGEEESPPSWLLVQGDSEPSPGVSPIVSLAVSPDSSQLFEYENLMLRCGANSSARGWKVRRFSTAPPGGVSTCGSEWGAATTSGCLLLTVKQRDSAIYWCESPSRQRSNSVNISVLGSPVLLQSPALPVTEGDNVTLTCRTKSSSPPASFFKDGVRVGPPAAGGLTLWPVTVADGGVYSCSVSGWGESPPSRLSVRGPSEDRDAGPGSGLTHLVLMVTRFLMVCSPYAVSTVLAVSLSRRHQAAGRKPLVVMTTSLSNQGDDELYPYDDVTTEHHF